jgi:hypothetical protein
MVEHLSGPSPLDDARPGVSFAVDRVEPGSKPYSTSGGLALVGQRLTRTIIHADLGADELIEPHDVDRLGPARDSNAFADAVHLAFSNHRPLIISPDVVWLTIAQGLAIHVNNHAEALRERLVPFAGKRTVTIERGRAASELGRGDWAEVIEQLAASVAASSNIDALPPIVASFSTTTPAARVASQVCLLDALSRYYDLQVFCICGFPQITVLGTVADWQDIRARVDRLASLGLGWWSEHLVPICDAFVATAAGAPDLEHWRGMYKPEEKYSYNAITGWFAKLFPYLLDREHVPSKRNPMLTGEGDHVGHYELPHGLSRVPIRVLEPGAERRLELIAGMFGVRQHSGTLALEPTIGWVVAAPAPMSAAIQAIAQSPEHESLAREQPIDWRERGVACADMMELFDAYEHVRLFADALERRIELDGPYDFNLQLDPDEPERRTFFYVVGRGPEGRELRVRHKRCGDRLRSEVFIYTDKGASTRVLEDDFATFVQRCLSEGPFWLRADRGASEGP